MKYIARQVNPMIQNCDFFYEDLKNGYYDVVVIGNRNYSSVKNELFELIENSLDELAEFVERIQDDSCAYYSDVFELFSEYFDREFSLEDAESLTRMILEYIEYGESSELYADIMTVVSGSEWIVGTIRGCMQSEWCEVIYESNVDIDSFESMFFNKGSEWILECIEDKEKFCVYISDGNTRQYYNEGITKLAIENYLDDVDDDASVIELVWYDE